MRKLLLALCVLSFGIAADVPDNLTIKAQCTNGHMELVRTDGINHLVYEPVLASEPVQVYDYDSKVRSAVNKANNERVYRLIVANKGRRDMRIVMFSNEDVGTRNVVYITNNIHIGSSDLPKLEICEVWATEWGNT